MDKSFIDIFKNFDTKVMKINSIINKINNKFNDDNFILNNDKLNLLLKISENLNKLNDQFDDLYDVVIETVDENNLTTEDKEKLRNNRINKKINDIFMPYIIYTKLCLNNN
jgi:hypothetical protein